MEGKKSHEFVQRADAELCSECGRTRSHHNTAAWDDNFARLAAEHAEMKKMLEATPRWTDNPTDTAMDQMQRWIEWDKQARTLLAKMKDSNG